MFPRLEINMRKLKHNAKTILGLCKNNGVSSCFLVTKVLAGNTLLVEELCDQGFSHIADSRMENLIKFQHIPLPKVLLRLPSKSEISQVVRYTDLSLNTELSTIRLLNDEAKNLQKKHNILLMFDLGDLREGIFYTDSYIETVEEILKLEHIHLQGIGTNLTCYGGVIPTTKHMKQLIAIKEKIETTFQIQLELISGGNSSSIYLLEKQKSLPEINNLRIGEAIFLGTETSFGKAINDTFQDVFTLQAELIELQTKPSFPVGRTGRNSFGEVTQIEDKGLMKRGIIAIGKQDIIPTNLFPHDPFIQVIGGSSDHTILDLTNSSYQLHQLLEFRVNYAGLLQLMTSKYVHKYIMNM